MAGHGAGYDPTLAKDMAHRLAFAGEGNRPAGGREAARATLESGQGLRAAINAWKRAAEPFRGLRFHDLRHLAITKLAESEASDQTIMALAGHMDRSMLEHYSHIRAAAKRKAVEAIRSYIPEEEPPFVTAAKRVQ